MYLPIVQIPPLKVFDNPNPSKIRSDPALVEQLTRQEQLERFVKFAEQCYIRSGKRLIPFAPLFAYQVELARLAFTYPGIVVVKDRQLGVTELFICWMLERARSNPAYAGCVFSLTEKDAFKVSNRVKRMPSKIPGFGWSVDSMGIRQPLDGGEMNFRPATENATRGLESIWDLMFDEAGFLKNNLISEMYAASTPSQEMVGDEAKSFIVSTIPSDGVDTWFWEQFEGSAPEGVEPEKMLEIAKSGKYLNMTRGGDRIAPIPGFVAWEDEGGWAKVVISHKAHPIYGSDPNYLPNQKKKKKLTDEQLNREFNLTLPKSGASLFNIDAVEKYATGAWEEPKFEGIYLAGLDPNMGGDDEWYLTIWRIDCYPYHLVAKWNKNNELPGYCRKESLKLLDRYKPILTVVEKNNGGLSQAEDIAAERPRLAVELVTTTGVSKIVNTDRAANFISDGDLRYPPDWEGIRQMKRFDRRLREGVREKDDAVMSMTIALAQLELALSLKPRRKPKALGNMDGGVRVDF